MNNVRVGHNKKKLVHPKIKAQDKFVKNVKVPKSANYKSSKEGDWGKG